MQKTKQKTEIAEGSEPSLADRYASFKDAQLMGELSTEEKEFLAQSRKTLEQMGRDELEQEEPLDLAEGMKRLREKVASGEIDLRYG